MLSESLTEYTWNTAVISGHQRSSTFISGHKQSSASHSDAAETRRRPQLTHLLQLVQNDSLEDVVVHFLRDGGQVISEDPGGQTGVELGRGVAKGERAICDRGFRDGSRGAV